MVTLRVWSWMAGPRAKQAASWRVACGAPMLLALMMWLCSLLLVMIFIAPFFGLRVASIVGLGLLVFFVLACRAICAIRVDPGKE
ncbi:MAG TPA: hypothetical protein VN648_17995 [Candidatus Methylomirabilis sp.]|nr:hypothetical protein [Candidatus Methylomirabilis sp.]